MEFSQKVAAVSINLNIATVRCQTVAANETAGLCMVVDGEFIVYLDIYEELDDELDFVLFTLMNERHELDDAHPYIQQVRYISLSADGSLTDAVEKENEGVQPQGNSAQLSASFYGLLAAGSLIIVATGIFWRRRRRNAIDLDGETTTVDPVSAQ